MRLILPLLLAMMLLGFGGCQRTNPEATPNPALKVPQSALKTPATLGAKPKMFKKNSYQPRQENSSFQMARMVANQPK